jgi:hypothetical protein
LRLESETKRRRARHLCRLRAGAGQLFHWNKVVGFRKTVLLAEVETASFASKAASPL